MHAVEITPAVPRPPHVTDAAFFDFDMRADPAFVANPHDRLLELHRVAPPVFWTPRNGGHWIMLSHEANFKAARDIETFSNTYLPKAQMDAMLAMMPKGGPHIPIPVPIILDPPDHTKFRIPLNGTFSPKSINAMMDDIRARANGLIDRVKPQGHCEAMADICEPLPVQVFLKLLGLPLEQQAEYRAIVREQMQATLDTDMGRTAAIMMKTAAVMRPVIEARREKPQNDIISMLWQTKIDGEPLSMEDMENYCILLFVAGLDTVMNGMGFGLRHLAMNPDLQAQLRADPSLIADATEEILRRYTFTVPPRRVAKDTVFQGVEMKENDRVMLFLPAADIDPKEFPSPEKFDLDREKKVHIAFNAGPHRCLGSHLARVELNVLYEQILTRLPEFRLDPANPPTFHGGSVVGVDSLHLLWDA